jgi:ssDNA-binding replication factor A large subunit
MIEEKQLNEGDVISIKDAAVRGTDIKELHLSSFSDLRKSDEEIEAVQESESIAEKKISDLKMNDRVRVRAAVAQAFDPRFFVVCRECKKKVNLENEKYVCKEHGIVSPEERALINLLIDDGISNIRAVCFLENFKKLFPGLEENELKNPDLFISKKQDLLGKELLFTGRVRQNKVFNTPEFIVGDVEEINTDALINELSK